MVEQQFRLLVASVKDYAIFLLDPAGHVATWNAGADGSRATAPKRSSASTSRSSTRPKDLARGKPQALEAPPATGASRTKAGGCARTAAGSGPTSSSRRFAIRTAQLPGVRQGHARPDRCGKNAEEKLRRSEENLAATLYSIGDGVLATDENGRVTRINPVAERLTGWSEGRRSAARSRRSSTSSTKTRARRRPTRSAACWRRAWWSGSPITPRSSRATAPSGRSPTAARRSATRTASRAGRCWFGRTEERRPKTGGPRRKLTERGEPLRATLYSIGDGVLATDERRARHARSIRSPSG